jgi:hypothetical protein
MRLGAVLWVGAVLWPRFVWGPSCFSVVGAVGGVCCLAVLGGRFVFRFVIASLPPSTPAQTKEIQMTTKARSPPPPPKNTMVWGLGAVLWGPFCLAGGRFVGAVLFARAGAVLWPRFVWGPSCLFIDAQAVRPQHSTPIPSKSMDLN